MKLFILRKGIVALAAFMLLFFLCSGYQNTPLYSSISPFILISVIAFIAPQYNGEKKRLLYIFSIIFGFIIAVANFDSYNVLGMICVGIAGFIIGYGCLEFIFGINFKEREHKKWVYWLIFGALSATYLIYLFAFNFPGSISTDAGMSLAQIQENKIANDHPFFYTLTLIPFQGNYALYCALQSIFTAGVFAFGIATVRKPIVAIPFIIIPYYMNWAQTMIKDTLFACFFLLFIISLYRIIKKMDNLSFIWLSIGIAGSALYRLNGSAIILITLIFTAFIIKNKKLTITGFAVLGGCYCIKYGVPAILHLQGSDLTESATLMQQQIAFALQKEDGELAKEANKFLPLEKWRNQYESFYADSIKYSLREYGYIQEHKKEYLDLWFKLGQKYPLEYIQAFIRNTRFYYNGAYVNDLRFWTVANMDYPGVSPYINLWVTKKDVGAVSSSVHPYLHAFLKVPVTKAVGLNTWVLGGLGVRGIGRKEGVVLIPFIVLLLTNIFLAPVPEFRYMLSLFFALPILVPMFLRDNSLFFCAKFLQRNFFLQHIANYL